VGSDELCKNGGMIYTSCDVLCTRSCLWGRDDCTCVKIL